MPMEHLNEHGKLCQGYFCSKCGKSCSMMGHNNKCDSNYPLVKRLTEINNAGSLEEYTFRKLRGDYD